MPRNDWEDALQSILTGAAQGYQTGQTGFQDVRKAIMLERIKKMLSPEETELKSAQAEYYRSRGKSALGELTSIPEGYEIGYDKAGRQILKSSKKPSETDTFRDNLRKAKQAIRSGESTIDEEISILQDLYPEKDFTTQKLGWKGLVPKPTKTQPTGKPFLSQVGETASNIGRGFMGLFNRPDIQNKIQRARNAKYSDEEIAAYLKGK